MKTTCSLSRAMLAATVVGLGTATLLANGTSGIVSSANAPRSGDGTAMKFTAIPASESGLNVANRYDDPAMWGDLYTEFQGGAIGTGIATGDIDGDGLVDLYVVNKTGPNQLFRQVAPFRFEDITAQAGVDGGTGAWHTGATLADVNNDGALDLYVCRFNAPNLLYLNDGHGKFTEVGRAAGVDLVSGSTVGTFEDFDRDGDLDLFVVTNLLDAKRNPDGEPDHLYRNRGDGTFEDITAAAGIAQENGRGHSAIWWDSNADGWPDLYVCNDFTVPDHLYRNNGDGTFTDVLAMAVPHTTWFSMGGDFGDINNDGLFDLFVADMAFTTHFKSKASMGDMGGLVNHMDTLVTPQYMKNAVFLNTGADRFREIAKMSGLGSTDWSWSPRFEDLDNDGWLDLHVTNGMVRTFLNTDLLNQAKKMSAPRDVITLMKNSPVQKETNLAYRNDHNLRFVKVQKEWGLDHEGVSFGSAFADLDRDGDLDLVYTNYENTVSLYRNDCPAANHSLIVELKGTSSNSCGIGAQVIAHTTQGVQIRKLTVERGALSSSEAIAAFGLGDATTVAALEVHWPSGQTQRFENLAADARYTITEPSGAAKPAAAVANRPADHGLFADESVTRGLDFVNQERVFDDMVRQSLLPNRMNTLGGGVAFGDVDNDGDSDIFFAGANGNAAALFLNDGKGAFTRDTKPQPWAGHTEIEGMSPLWLDVNGDGRRDLFLTSGSVEVDKGNDALRSRLYLNTASGVFTEADASQVEIGAVSSSIAATADFDRDGALEVFVGGRVIPGDYPRTPESRLLKIKDGRLVDVTDQVCPALRNCGMVTAALWSDADGDGFLDLLVTGEWMPLRLFTNNHAGVLTEATAAAGLDVQSGWWNSLVGADVNQDGAIDYIAGNTGLNTKYHPSADHPVSVYYGDFDNTGNCNIVEAEYEGDKLFPVRGRSCSSRAMPALKEKFPTFNEWGAALLPEIYTDEKLGSALRVSVTQLASGVFLNDGKAHFTFQALPRIAQTSPGFGLAAVDVNGDSFVDLFIAQNFAGPQVETGRFDGGISILLLGDGKGGFKPATAQESGIAIPGEGRGVAVSDLNRDGWPDLVVTRINERALTLVDRGVAGGHSFAVKLQGRSRTNPDAIGARVAVRYANGATQAQEIYAGSGYLSQSDALAFFGYSEANPPTTIDVLWPDGKTSSHLFQTAVPQITIVQ